MPENHKAMTENAAPAPGSAALLDPRLPRVWQVRRPHARLLAEARVHNAGGKGTEAAGASGAGGGDGEKQRVKYASAARSGLTAARRGSLLCDYADCRKPLVKSARASPTAPRTARCA